MKRIIPGVLALMVLGPSTILAADVTTKTKRSSTNKIEISGDIGLQGVFREDSFDSVFPQRDLHNPGTWTRDHDEIIGVPVMNVSLEAKIKDELGAVLTLGLGPGSYGVDSPLLGRRESLVFLEEIYAYSKEFLGKYTNLYVGSKNVRIDLRGNGDEFFCNLLASENPFTGAVHTDPGLTGMPQSVSGIYAPAYDPADPTTPIAANLPNGSSGFGMHWNPYLGGNAWWNQYAGQSKNSAFAGVQLEWILSRDKTGLEPFRVDFAVGKVLETQMANTDTVFFVARPLATFDITGTHKHKHFSRIQAVLSMISGDDDTALGALGFGFSIKPLPFLEVFAEYMGQFGEYTAAYRPDGKELIHQGAHAGYGGVRVEPEIKIEKQLSFTPFAEFSLWWIGGDRGDPHQSNHDYVSFEDVDTFLIMEDNEFGLDVDSNYNAIKAEIGARFETVELSVRFGTFHALFPPSHDVYGNPPDGGSSYRKLYGNELNIRLSWKVKECVKLGLGAGLLFDAFFWKDTLGAREEMSLGIAEIMVEF